MDTKTLSVGDYVRCGGQCHRVTGTTDRGTFYSAKVPPPRKLKTPIFGRDPVPFGRRADVLAGIDGDHAALAWVEANPRDPFGGDYLYQFACPLALEVARDTAAGQRKYVPVAKGASR